MKSIQHIHHRSQIRKKDYALSVIWLFAELPKRTETQVHDGIASSALVSILIFTPPRAMAVKESTPAAVGTK